MHTKKIKALISTVLIITGLLMLGTGLVLHFVQRGMWLIFTRKFLKDVHFVCSLIMAGSMAVHFLLNSKIYISEIKALLGEKRSKQ